MDGCRSFSRWSRALGAAQYAARASQMTYKGTVALAPASNFSLILAGGEAQAGQEPDLNKRFKL